MEFPFLEGFNIPVDVTLGNMVSGGEGSDSTLEGFSKLNNSVLLSSQIYH